MDIVGRCDDETHAKLCIFHLSITIFESISPIVARSEVFVQTNEAFQVSRPHFRIASEEFKTKMTKESA
jgi:hypothetical protein